MSRRRRSSTRKGGRRKAIKSSQRYDPTNFDPDYTYVLRDLRQIGLLAGSFLVVLVILSFILN
jgi:hypothetical protein